MAEPRKTLRVSVDLFWPSIAAIVAALAFTGHTCNCDCINPPERTQTTIMVPRCDNPDASVTP